MFIAAEDKCLKLVMDMGERRQEREMDMREEEREMVMREEEREMVMREEEREMDMREEEREMIMREEEREMVMREEERKHEEIMMQMMLLMSPGYQSQRYTNTQMNTGMHMNNHADMSNTDGLTLLTMLSTPSTSHSHTHTAVQTACFTASINSSNE